mgnify:CR=1 FL=1
MPCNQTRLYIYSSNITNRITKRERPYSELAARTIGYENKDENLYVGIEGAYSNYLTGKAGKQLRRRINHGDWIPVWFNAWRQQHITPVF